MTSIRRDLRVGVYAVLVSACMLLCVLSPAITSWTSDDSPVASGGDSFTYYALGDSTANGFGFVDYYPGNGSGYRPYATDKGLNPYGFLMDVPLSYPGLLKAYIEKTYGKDVNDDYMLAVSGMRSAELRALLYDDFADTTYVDFEDESSDLVVKLKDAIASLADYGYKDPTIKDLRDFYQKKLKTANLLTYNFHYDFGYTLSDAIVSFIRSFGPGDPSEPDPMNFAIYGLDESVVQEYIAAALTKIMELIGLPADDSNPLYKLARYLAAAVVYVVVSYCSNFDANMAWFKENTKAKVVYIDAYNTFGDKGIVYDGVNISLGGIYEMMLEGVNAYVKHASPYAKDVTIIDVYDCPELYSSEFSSADGKLSPDTKRAAVNASEIWNSDEFRDIPYSEIDSIYDDYDVGGNLTKLFKHIFGINAISFEGFFNVDESKVEAKLAEAIVKIKDGATVTFDEGTGSCTVSGMDPFSSDELTVLWMTLFLNRAEALMSHPSNNGHEYLFDRIVNSLDTTYMRGGTTQYISASFVDGLKDSPIRLMDLLEVLGGKESDGLVKINDDSASGLRDRITKNNVIVIEADSGNLPFIISELAKRLTGGLPIVGDPADLDYGRFSDMLDPLAIAYLNELVANLGPYLEMLLNEFGLGHLSDTAINVLDLVLYTYMNMYVSMIEVTKIVKSLNKDATIIFVGGFNPLKGCGLEISYGDMSLNLPKLGDYLDKLLMVTNGIIREYCDAEKNVVYLDVTDMPSKVVNTKLTIKELMNFLVVDWKDNELRPDTEYITERVEYLLNNVLTPIGDEDDDVTTTSDTNWLLIGGGVGAALLAVGGVFVFFRLRR